MFSRSVRVARPVSNNLRFFATSRIQLQTKVAATATKLSEVTGPDDSLIGKGAAPGTIPTDLDQATGLERFEYLGKREGIDVFDLENPVSVGAGTMADPYQVPSYIGNRYVGCTGKDGEQHDPYWMQVEDGKPGRCWHCGNVFAIKYLGEPGHSHH
ncbi:cytochrome c oxidase subunit 4, mitochondrial [[Candida] anglica]|uniref:Cytochrome c oxidase subunit 4, mitochondrial n=1 Tax=[Candida] anglica TaxID=148631 RepID=A0ABP0EAE4_9ASCO